jgi:hypothetical protein
VTLYTPKQRFPYPATAEEYGNGAVHLEALAVAADAGLDRISANWVALRSPGRVIYKLAANYNIPVGNGLTDFTPPFPTFNTVVASSNVTGQFPFSLGGPKPNNYGWWDITIHVETSPSGAANPGTRRYLQAAKVNTNNRGGDDLNVYIWEDQETSTGTISAAELNFFIRSDALTGGIFLAYLHTNTSSSVNILAAGTYLQALQVSGPVS